MVDMQTVTIRPQKPADDEACGRLWLEAIGSVRAAAALEVIPPTPAAIQLLSARYAHVRATDPSGLRVAEVGGRVAGLCHAIERGALWMCSLFAVAPDVQGSGIGRRLVAASFDTDPARPGLIIASTDPKARARYEAAGFTARPTRNASRAADPSALPAGDFKAVRDGTSSDFDWIDALDRDVRGSARTGDTAFYVRMGGRLLVVPDRGYVVVDRKPILLGARDGDAARQLLLASLAVSDVWEVSWIGEEAAWASGLLASLEFVFEPGGPVMVRGGFDLPPNWLPHGGFG